MATPGSSATAIAIGSGRSKPSSNVCSRAELDEGTLDVDTELAERTERTELRGIVGRKHGVVARDVPADHRDRRTRVEHERRRLRVGPDVELGDGETLPTAVGGAAHHTSERSARADVGRALERGATFVSGPSVTSVSRPGSARIASTRTSAASPGRRLAPAQLEADVAHAVGAVHVVRECCGRGCAARRLPQ